MGLKSLIKKVKGSKDKEEAIKVVKSKIVKDKNIGDPILGMGVKFYPSESVLNNFEKKDFALEGKVVEIFSGTIIKVSVLMLDGTDRIFKSKNVKDPSFDKKVDNSWE